MRRYTRTIIIIGVFVLLAGATLWFEEFQIANFKRGTEGTVLGLKLGLDLQGGSDLVYRAVDRETGEPIIPAADDMRALKRSIERRVNASGLGEPNIQLLGEDRLLVQLPGIRDLDRAKDLIGETAQLVFKRRQLNVSREMPGVQSEDVLDVELTTMERLAGQLSATTTQPRSPDTEAAISEARKAAEQAAGEVSTSTLDDFSKQDTSTEATSTNSTLANGKVTSTSVLLDSDFSSEATTTGMLLPFSSTTTNASATSSSASFDPRNETGTPALVLRLSSETAEEFQAAVDRMRESMDPVTGTGRIFPNSLKLITQGGGQSSLDIFYYPMVVGPNGGLLPIQTEPTVRRIGNSDRFVFNMALSFDNFGEAYSNFATSTSIDLGETLGKVDEDVPGGLTGEDLARAYPGQHSTTNMPIVNIEFNPNGAEKFARVTADIASSGGSDLLAIILDGKELISPTVRQAITGGTAFIEGGQDFTFDRVRDISLLLEAGRLPVPIELIQERDVDAILGADSLSKSIRAGLVGLGLVLLFMVMYYRMPGIIAALALAIYALLLLALFKVLPVTLTLAGVAAAILSIGMAVDANILIFERMKEELRGGRTLFSAINIGFNRAWPAIRDSNVSTLITCGILFWFSDQLGATIVQGFAVTLAIGVGTSLFTAITVSRTLLRVAALTRIGKRMEFFIPAGKRDLV